MGNKRAVPVKAIVQSLAVIAVIALGVAAIWRWQLDQKGDPDHLVVSGTVEGDEVGVGSKTAGRISRLYFSEGAEVKAGEVLAEFDAPELKAQKEQAVAAEDQAVYTYKRLQAGARPEELARARAQLDAAKAQLRELTEGSRPEDIQAARSAWQAAQAQADLAAKNLRRARQLYEAGVIPKSQIDAAQAAADNAANAARAAEEQFRKAEAGPRQTQLDAARAQVRAAQAALDLLLAGAHPDDLAAAQARVKQAQAALAGVGVSLGESRVVAPADGVIQTSNFKPGDLVSPGAAIYTMIINGSYYVQVFIPEQQLAWATPGTRARLLVDGYPDIEFSGEVFYLAPQGEFTPRNLQTKEKRVEQVFRCKLKLDDPQGQLRPGMVCDVIFTRPGAEAAVE